MKIVSLNAVPRAPVNMEGAKNAFKQMPISSADGAPTFSFRVFTLEPEGHTPFHEHASEHLNYVISGSGCLVDPSGREHDIKQRDFALVLPSEKHQYKNTSRDKPLVLICAVPTTFE